MHELPLVLVFLHQILIACFMVYDYRLLLLVKQLAPPPRSREERRYCHLVPILKPLDLPWLI